MAVARVIWEHVARDVIMWLMVKIVTMITIVQIVAVVSNITTAITAATSVDHRMAYRIGLNTVAEEEIA